MDLGRRIKARRNSMGLSLKDLSIRSGVSPAMISDIESDKKNPTIRVAYMIATGLDCSLTDLLDVQPAHKHKLLRNGEHHTLVDPTNGVQRRLLSPEFVSRGMQILRITLPPGADMGEFPPERPDVLKHVTILSGALDAWIGRETFRLLPGDSATFSADQTHGARNTGDVAAEFFHIVDTGRPGCPPPMYGAPARAARP